MRRKLLAYTASMMAGILFCHFCHLWGSLISGALLLSALSLLRRRQGKKQEKDPFRLLSKLVIASFLFGAILFYGESQIFLAGTRYDGTPADLCLYVENVTADTQEQCKLSCKILKVDGHALPRLLPQRVLLTCRDGGQPIWKFYRQTLQLRTILSQPQSPGNPHTFDYALYLKSKGISHVATSYRPEVSGGHFSLADALRRKILHQREEFLASLRCDKDTRALIRGIMFGDTSSLEEDVYNQFRANGTAHVLAVSGLHVGILFSLYRALSRKKKTKLKTGLFLTVLFFYGTISLWSVSVTRAVLMILLMMLGEANDRRYDLLTSLSVVALWVLIRHPYAIFGAAFQMSFLAVASMAFLAPYLLRKLPPSVPAPVSGILAIQAAMVPYSAYVFNYVPLTAMFCNIPVVYLLTILVPEGLASMALSLFTGDSGVAGTLLVSTSRMLLHLNSALSMEGRFMADVASPSPWCIVLLYGVMLFIASETGQILRSRRNTKAIAAFLLSLLVLAFLAQAGCRSPLDKASLIFPDVGQGDCLHIHSASTDILIDGGGKKDYNVGLKVLKPYLLKNGVTKIHLALATHLHTDHYKGLQELTECFQVMDLKTEGRAGDMIRAGPDCHIELIWPVSPDPSADDENLNSLIFKVYLQRYTVLVTGDLTQEGERALLDHYRGTDVLDCDILKVAHHGSRFSSTLEFLKAVSPKIAVICVGKNNYGHPSPDALGRLKDCGIKIYRTDTMGAIGIIVKKNGLQVATNR